MKLDAPTVTFKVIKRILSLQLPKEQPRTSAVYNYVKHPEALVRVKVVSRGSTRL